MSLAMLLGIMPSLGVGLLVAQATGDTNATNESYVGIVPANVALTNPTPTELQAAINNASSGDEVVVNITDDPFQYLTNSTIIIPPGVTLTFTGSGTLHIHGITFRVWGTLFFGVSAVNATGNFPWQVFEGGSISAAPSPIATFTPGGARPGQGNNISTVNPTAHLITFEPGSHGLFESQNVQTHLGQWTPDFPGTLDGVQGWMFIGWYPEVSPVVLGNATYIAQWVQEWTVIFIVDGAEVDRQTVDAGSLLVARTEPSAEQGYRFIGWREVNGFIWNFAEHRVGYNNTLTAAFEAIQYGVRWDANGGIFASNGLVTNISHPLYNAPTIQNVGALYHCMARFCI